MTRFLRWWPRQAGSWWQILFAYWITGWILLLVWPWRGWSFRVASLVLLGTIIWAARRYETKWGIGR
jgi:hypothetical protein